MARLDWHGDNLIAHVWDAVEAVCERVGLVMVGRVQQDTPVKTGAARDSVGFEIEHTATSITIRVAGTVAYFQWIEIGTRGRPGRAPLGKNLADGMALLQQELAGMRL